MRRAALACATAALAALVGCGGGGSGGQPAASASAPQTQTTKVQVIKADGNASSNFDPQTIYKTEAPGVVTLIALNGGSQSALGRASEALGSGFVVDPRGYIATNSHVVTSDSGKPAGQIYVEFADGNQVQAKVAGVDLDSDVAVVKVDPSQLRGDARLTVLPWGSTENLEVGDSVAAIGSPFGEEQSLSVGVVSALNRDIESLTKFRIGNAIQTDAAINHGNSGGPLLDASGKVIGINSQIQSSSGGGEGVGFAVPVETVKRSVDQLIAKGRVDYAYLGVSTVTLYPQLAERLKIKESRGALIADVVSGGPADKAGLRGAKSTITFQAQPKIPVGSDVVLAVDGHELRQAQDLSDLIGRHEPGNTVQLTVDRGGQRKTISVTLGKRPEKSG